MYHEAIIRHDLKTDKWRVYDAFFYDDGMRFDTKLEALQYAKSRGYTFADVPDGCSVSVGIDILIKNHG